MSDKKRPATICVHSGGQRNEPYHSITTPIVQSAPCPFPTTKNLRDYMEERSSRIQPEYGRMGNPTVTAVERRLAGLEGGEQALLFASGMAAITTTLLVLLKSGDHVVITNDSYRRTRDFLVNFMAKYGIQCTIVEPSAGAIEAAVTKNTTLLLSESPTNPYLNILDVAEVAEIGKRHSITTIIDSTFATPINQRPLEFGIDLVVHAATKYIGGHHDIIAGVIIGASEIVQPIYDMHKTIGGICDPNTAFLLERGIKTLDMRMSHLNRNTQKVAEFLEIHPKVERVYYPGLLSHPHYEIARSQMKGFGGVVSFLIKTDLEGTLDFVDRLEIPYLAPSFGGPESLVDPPALMSFWDIKKEDREKIGIFDNLLRLSIGYEDVDDIIADLKQSLDKV